MFCQYCGRTVRDGAAFCPHCGKPVGLQSDAPDTEATAADPAGAAAGANSTNDTAQAPVDNPAVGAPQTPKKSHAALIAGLAVGAVFVLIVLGVVLFAIPMFQGAKKASSSSATVIELSKLEDSAWASYLSQNVDKNDDGHISRREAELVTSIGNLAENLTAGNGLCSAGVYNLEGIEYFTNLKVLLVYDNYLTGLDLSHNTALRYLDCSENILATLELPACDSLETVYAYGNMFSELDVTDCPNLDSLSVDSFVSVTGWTGDPSDYVYDGGSWLDYDYDFDDSLDYDELLDELLDEDGNGDGADSSSADSDLQST